LQKGVKMKKLITILSMFTLGFFLCGTASAALVQWTTGSGANNHWYEVITNLNITWTAADALPGATVPSFGYLATITSKEENAFITGLLTDPSSTNVNWGWWLGGSDAASEGNWKWVRGPESGSAFSYTNWRSNEPNDDAALGGNADFLTIRWEKDGDARGTWADRPIGSTKTIGYVVEYDQIPIPGAVWMLGSGLIGLIFFRRKFTK
jgi:hypothetical protein